MRRTGIEVVGDAPWGTHFCLFYATKDDLTDILVPYFKAGLDAGEFCMWVTSPPLGVREARDALARAVPDLDAYHGHIEIIPHTEWYLLGGSFEQDRVLKGWVTKLNDALARGCAGLRLTGNTFWLEKSGWRSFTEYEAAVDGVLGQYRMLALCTYSLERCGASEVADVIRNHQFALIKRDGRWDLFESFDRRRMQDALTVERERLAITLQSIGDAVIAIDIEGRVTTLNRVAEDLTGWSQAEASGRPVGEVFRIVDEKSGVPAEDPVRKVLDLGTVVGLANHTALITRDGRQVSIADSAAPIRGRGGAILGVVLVFRDVTLDRRAEEALRRSEAELKEADRRKNEFLAMLSHELRNPLAPMRNSLYLLDRAPSDSPQSARAREVLGRQMEHLTRLVDDLLDLTRISHGKIELRRAVVDARDIVQKTCADHGTVFEQRGIYLEVEIPGTALWIDADATRISQAIRNLLLNAAKFAKEGGTVLVSVTRAADQVEVSVRDDGIGMESRVLARVFEPFVQAERGQERTRGGLGLGLALVKGLVEAHGGSVWAESEGASRGSRFVFCLPHAPPPERKRDIPRHSAPAITLDVLVIEDNVDGAETLAAVLELHGHRAHIATDGLLGLRRARELKPDVILCDIDLPGLDGYELARRLRSEGGLAATRLIALSGYARAGDRQLAFDAGFTAHLPKPISVDELNVLLGNKT